MTLMQILSVLICKKWIVQDPIGSMVTQEVAQIVLLVWMVSKHPMLHRGQVKGGAMDILQQIAQALQRVAQPAVFVPQVSAIERMEKYRPMDFLGKKDDEPSMTENWLERTERMLRKMHCTPKENL